MRILIVKIGAAGDVLRTTAMLPGLKQKYPKSQIDWLTETANLDILTGNPDLNAIYCIDALPYTFRRRSYDLVFNLDEEPDICHLVSQVKTKRLVGTYLKDGVITYTKSAALRFDMSRVSQLGVARADLLKKRNRKTYQHMCYEMIGAPFQSQRPSLHITSADRTFAAQFASAHGIQADDMIIGISSSAGAKWPNKRLSIPETVRLIQLIHRRNPKAKILLLGGPNEAVRNSEIHSQCPQVINSGCHHPIKRFAAIVNLCSTLITSDSFPLHVGTALGKHVVAFFGPTSPHEIELYGNGKKILPKSGCVACFRPKCIIPLKHDLEAIARAV
jgi:heptosyltransferase-2